MPFVCGYSRSLHMTRKGEGQRKRVSNEGQETKARKEAKHLRSTATTSQIQFRYSILSMFTPALAHSRLLSAAYLYVWR